MVQKKPQQNSNETLGKGKSEQECIPVGCLQTTAVSLPGGPYEADSSQ